jgi:hypothetical protein
VLKKGVILEQWGHKIYWVAQEPAYRRLIDGFGLYDLDDDPDHATVFVVYDLCASDNGYSLQQTRSESATVDALFKAFQHNTAVPSVDDFVRTLKANLSEGQSKTLHLSLGMD